MSTLKTSMSFSLPPYNPIPLHDHIAYIPLFYLFTCLLLGLGLHLVVLTVYPWWDSGITPDCARGTIWDASDRTGVGAFKASPGPLDYALTIFTAFSLLCGEEGFQLVFMKPRFPPSNYSQLGSGSV